MVLHRVQELTTNIEEERGVKQELVDTVKAKDEEIEVSDFWLKFFVKYIV